MHFCKNCDNMYYIKSQDDNCDKIIYYCRNCGDTDDTLIDMNKCIIKENINRSEDKYNIFINKYTKLDITLPRIKHIKCPNHDCESNKKDFNQDDKEIIYIRYDDVNMKYLYLCSHCNTTWKTD